MRVLALDTSTTACSAAIGDSENRQACIVARRFDIMERGQSEALAPMVQAVLRDVGCGVRDMDCIAVTTGPGAFTGVRIGLSMARSLGLSANIPIVGVSTMHAVASAVPVAQRRNAHILVIMDTKREDVYVQTFDTAVEAVTEPNIALPQDLPAFVATVPDGIPTIVTGDAVARIRVHLPERTSDISVLEGNAVPDAAVVAEIALSSGPPARHTPPPKPIYLRSPYAKISPTGGKLRP